jgi:glycosyltransferase involved in cell wall biosynthesis
MVNDGSKDASAVICQEYCERFSNFKLINQENSGVSAARNKGLDAARGKYIVFLDADDYLLDNGLRLASSQFRNRDDVDVIHYFSSYDFWPIKPIDNTLEFDGTGHDYILHSGLPSFCWLFFYKKSFLDNHQIRFKPYIVGEDQLFSSTVCIANPRIVSTKADIYRYVVREDSATTKRDVTHTRRCVVDYLNAYHDIILAMEKYGVSKGMPVYNKCMASLNNKKIFGFSRILSSGYRKKEYRKIMKKCREIGFYPVINANLRAKGKLTTMLMNSAMNCYLIYKIAGFGFNNIVVPYVLPKLRTNL